MKKVLHARADACLQHQIQFIKYYVLTCMAVSYSFCDGFNLFPQSLHSALKCRQPLLHYTSLLHEATKAAEADKGVRMGQMLTLMGAAQRFGTQSGHIQHTW